LEKVKRLKRGDPQKKSTIPQNQNTKKNLKPKAKKKGIRQKLKGYKMRRSSKREFI